MWEASGVVVSLRPPCQLLYSNQQLRCRPPVRRFLPKLITWEGIISGCIALSRLLLIFGLIYWLLQPSQVPCSVLIAVIPAFKRIWIEKRCCFPLIPFQDYTKAKWTYPSVITRWTAACGRPGRHDDDASLNSAAVQRHAVITICCYSKPALLLRSFSSKQAINLSYRFTWKLQSDKKSSV